MRTKPSVRCRCIQRSCCCCNARQRCEDVCKLVHNQWLNQMRFPTSLAWRLLSEVSRRGSHTKHTSSGAECCTAMPEVFLRPRFHARCAITHSTAPERLADLSLDLSLLRPESRLRVLRSSSRLGGTRIDRRSRQPPRRLTNCLTMRCCVG